MHAFRRAFESLAIGDNGNRECIRAILHTSERDITDVYQSLSWDSICEAVLKLDVRLDREPDEVAAAAKRESGDGALVDSGNGADRSAGKGRRHLPKHLPSREMPRRSA